MKKLIFAALTCLITLGFSLSTSAQNSADIHRILYIKFKPGKAAEGMEIGKKYFSKAYAEAGHSTEVLEITSKDGIWDGIIMIPLSAGTPEAGQAHPKIVLEKMKQIAGSEAALQKINERFFSLVERQRMDLAKLERFSE